MENVHEIMELTAGSMNRWARSFGSDNWSGVHSDIMRAMQEVNYGHALPYGNDELTQHLREIAAQIFGAPALVFPVFNGVGANNFALSLCCPRHAGIVCAQTAHIMTDEAGASEYTIGAKLMSVDALEGKLTPELIATQLRTRGSQHQVEPVVVSIANLTELGTSYTAEEITEIVNYAHSEGLLVMLDGARLANAAAEQGCSIAELSGLCGVDVLCLGTTKNGALFGECVFVNAESQLALPSHLIPGLRKQLMQLGSKSRFITAQILAMYEGELWRELALQANRTMKLVEEGLRELGIEILFPRGGNQLFISCNKELVSRECNGKRLDRDFGLAALPASEAEPMRTCRLVCSWDTTEEDVQALLAQFKLAMQA